MKSAAVSWAEDPMLQIQKDEVKAGIRHDEGENQRTRLLEHGPVNGMALSQALLA